MTHVSYLFGVFSASPVFEVKFAAGTANPSFRRAGGAASRLALEANRSAGDILDGGLDALYAQKGCRFFLSGRTWGVGCFGRFLDPVRVAQRGLCGRLSPGNERKGCGRTGQGRPVRRRGTDS
ncbi:hypothetical protein HMPREF9440_02256 [Sutterella parvirubra YIT 11816]|uniref:Uncharacterized protein n=1 Tax=Sutterella parvirubra YIT 11816 TaxID=762967 RepID=H3KHL1_9BURK|nr:hypothetical protein HMPREF9440_02256 [Sutterella parvirubra YIT 11816]